MPTKQAKPVAYIVKDGFTADLSPFMFPAGERFASDHPAVKKYPQLFRAEVEEPQIEQATAAPGEKR